MGKYDFDEITPRYNTDCIKYDFAVERGLPKDVLPLWVADMDFKTAPCIRKALEDTSRYGIWGYSNTKDAYCSVVTDWFKRRHGVEYANEWLIKTPGVVFALSQAIRAFTKEGDNVLVQPPVYYPFYSSITNNNRKVVRNELVYKDGHYTVDFADFEEKIAKNDVKLFILCSPHNPVGRVWKKDELTKMVGICKKYNVLVIADEIHCDFTYKAYTHLPLLKVCPEYKDSMVVCTAPSKSFNLAGLQVSNIFIPNEELRKKFKASIAQTGYDELGLYGIRACVAAYSEGEDWLDELKEYLEDNLAFLRNFLKERIPSVKLVEPEGTYLVWLDFSKLNLSRDELDDLIINKAGLWLDAGHIFGGASDAFQRVVIACPRKTLEEALIRLENAIK